LVKKPTVIYTRPSFTKIKTVYAVRTFSMFRGNTELVAYLDRNFGEVIYHFLYNISTQCTTCIGPQINNLADPDNKVVEMAPALQAVIDLQHIEPG